MLRRRSRLDEHGYSRQLALHTANTNWRPQTVLLGDTCNELRATLQLCTYVSLPVLEERISQFHKSGLTCHIQEPALADPLITETLSIVNVYINLNFLDLKQSLDHAPDFVLAYKGLKQQIKARSFEHGL
jgi:hypothetical protein